MEITWIDISEAIVVSKLEGSVIENKRINNIIEYLDSIFSCFEFYNIKKLYYSESYDYLKVKYIVYLRLSVFDYCDSSNKDIIKEIIDKYLRYKYDLFFDNIVFN